MRALVLFYVCAVLAVTSCYSETERAIRQKYGVVISVSARSLLAPARVLIHSAGERYTAIGYTDFAVGDSVSFVIYPECINPNYVYYLTLERSAE